MSVNLTSTNKNFKKKLEWIFKLYDIDSNGRIEYDEFRKIFLSIFKLLDQNNNYSTDQFREQHIKDLFGKIDTDKNKYITLDEFVDACCRDKMLLELLAPSA
jgi:Ca2+-binding EF-hand superfamily protein